MKDKEKRKLIKKYFPRSEWQRAWNVMQGESGGNPSAVGDKYPIKGIFAPSVGLFQIRTLPGRPSAKQLKNPEFNVKYAANMQSEQGWQPWTVAQKLGYTNGVKGVKMENEELSSSFKERANAFREKAKTKGWSSKKTEAFIDRKAEDELVRRGDITTKDIPDPSRRLGLEEEGVPTPPPFEPGEIIDRTKEYLGQIGTYGTREEAMADFEIYKPIMEKEGIDVQLVLGAINRKFPEEEEAGIEAGGLFGKTKGFFERMFSKEVQEKPPEERTFMEKFFRRPVIFG